MYVHTKISIPFIMSRISFMYKKMKKTHTVLMIHCLKYMKTHHNMSITPFSLGEFIIDDSNKLYRNQ